MIDIVIVHWNTPDLLMACLDSIDAIRQHGEPVGATIVVDSASLKRDVADEISEPTSVSLISLGDNPGYAAACNRGFERTEQDCVLFLNADTVVEPGALPAILNCFALNPRIGLVAPLLLNENGTIQSAGYYFPGIINVACDLLPMPDRIRGSTFNGVANPGHAELPYVVDYALGAALAVRSDALQNIGGWSERYEMYSEEIDLARRLADAGWRCIVEPRGRVVHHGGASTRQRPRAMQEALWESRGKYHRLWSSPVKQAMLRAVVSCATRVPSHGDSGRAIRTAFTQGLHG